MRFLIASLILIPAIAHGQTVDDVWFELDGSASPRELGRGISGTRTHSIQPVPFVDPNGTIYLAWKEWTTSHFWDPNQIHLVRWNGEEWEEIGEQSASGGGVSDSVGHSYGPDVVFGVDEQPIVAYTDTSNGDAQIYVKRWNGTEWVELGEGAASEGGISDSCGDSLYLDMDIDQQGFPIIAWEQQYPVDYPDGTVTHTDILVRRWDGHQWPLVGLTGVGPDGVGGDLSSDRPSLAVTSDGIPILAWRTSAGTSPIQVAQWTGSEWERLEGVTGGVAPDLDQVSPPTLLLHDDDTVSVLFSSDEDVFLRTWNGTAWEATIEPDRESESDDLEYWDAALGADGMPIVVYADRNSSEIYARRWNGSAWVEISIGSGTGGGISRTPTPSSFPSVVIDARGMPIVAWTEDLAYNYDDKGEIYLRRWNGDIWATDNPWVTLGNNSCGVGGVSSTPVASFGPEVTVNDDGEPLVLWWDERRADDIHSGEFCRAREWRHGNWIELGSEVMEAHESTRTWPSYSPSPWDLDAVHDSNGSLHVMLNTNNPTIFLQQWDGASWLEDAAQLPITWAPSVWEYGYYGARMVINDDNQAIVGHRLLTTWASGDLAPGRIVVHQRTDEGWEELINTEHSSGLPGSGTDLHLAAEREGNPLIAFQNGTDAQSRIVLRRWVGDHWEDAYPIIFLGLGGGDYSSLALRSSDEPTVAYEFAHSDEPMQIHVLEWRGSEWVELSTDDETGVSNSICFSTKPQIAIDPSNRPLVAWLENIPDISSGDVCPQVHMRRWDGERWLEIGSGSATDGGISNSFLGVRAFCLTLDSLGNPFVAWQEGNWNIYLRTAILWHDLPGSANGDDVVDIADLVALTNHLNGTVPILHPMALSNADLNDDGEITQADADALIELLLGNSATN